MFWYMSMCTNGDQSLWIRSTFKCYITWSTMTKGHSGDRLTGFDNVYLSSHQMILLWFTRAHITMFTMMSHSPKFPKEMLLLWHNNINNGIQMIHNQVDDIHIWYVYACWDKMLNSATLPLQAAVFPSCLPDPEIMCHWYQKSRESQGYVLNTEFDIFVGPLSVWTSWSEDPPVGHPERLDQITDDRCLGCQHIFHKFHLSWAKIFFCC